MCGGFGWFAKTRRAVQMSKMLISSPEFKCSNEILTIVAMLSGESSQGGYRRSLNHLPSTQRLATAEQPEAGSRFGEGRAVGPRR